MAQSKALVAKASEEVVKIDADQTLKASKALLQHITKAAKEASESSGKRNILDEDDSATAETPIWLTIATKRHIADSTRLQPAKIPLPHSLNDNEHSSICLITAQPQRAYKDIVASDSFPAQLGKRVTRVIDVNKLAAKYGQYEAQRKLFSEHEIFLADTRIINRLPKILGKTFYKSTQKRPVAVVLQSKQKKTLPKGQKKQKGQAAEPNAGKPEDIAKEIEKALGAALVNLGPSAHTAVRVAYAGWSAEQVSDNVAAVASALVEKHVSGGWKNVKSIQIKGPETAALPVWLTDELWLEEADVVANDDPKALNAEKANVGKKRKGEAAAVEEGDKVVKKTKKTKEVVVKESDDAKLDRQISDRKARLRKAKAKASQMD